MQLLTHKEVDPLGPPLGITSTQAAIAGIAGLTKEATKRVPAANAAFIIVFILDSPFLLPR